MRLIDADTIVEKYKKKIERIKGRVEILEKNKEASVYDLVPKIFQLQERIEEYWSLIDEVENAETVDAESMKHGKWVPDEADKWRCSVCGIGNNYAYKWSVKGNELQDKYCPNCGARMDGEDD